MYGLEMLNQTCLEKFGKIQKNSKINFSNLTTILNFCFRNLFQFFSKKTLLISVHYYYNKNKFV